MTPAPATVSAAPPPDRGTPRVALVHDWLTGMRGGERVLDTICELFPDADLFTLLHVPGSVSPRIEARPVRTSFIQRLPGSGRRYRPLLPLFPAAVEQFDLDGFDLIISTSHCVAKSIVKPGRARHLCYCFTPMRYVWDQFPAYFGPRRVGAGVSRGLRRRLAAIARWDAATAHRADRYVAISQYVADRIDRYYNRRANIVHPPVDTSFFRPGPARPRQGCLIVSALVPYKRVDLALSACAQAGVPLRIVGDGPELPRLRRAAGPDVEFLGPVSDEQVRHEYRSAAAFLLPGAEDFGIAPVEAQACGCPVVALAAGGARETVADGETGILVDEPEPEAFADAVAGIHRLPADGAAFRRQALRFSRERFRTALRAEVASLMTASLPELRR